MKKSIKRLANWFGYDIARLPAPLLEKPSARLYPTYELLVPSLLGKLEQVYFMQIGANDGCGGDPIHRYVADQGWRGVLVEPQRESFARLKETYAGREGLMLVNAAVSDADGTRELYKVKAAPGLPAYASELASFKRDVIVKHKKWIPNIEELIEVEQVRCVTLATLVKEGALECVDVFQVDTEGFDGEIIRMIDFRLIKPKIICYEWKHLCKADHAATAAHLINNGYKLAIVNQDVMACLVPES